LQPPVLIRLRRSAMQKKPSPVPREHLQSAHDDLAAGRHEK
jgi:hypothetical protein